MSTNTTEQNGRAALVGLGIACGFLLVTAIFAMIITASRSNSQFDSSASQNPNAVASKDCHNDFFGLIMTVDSKWECDYEMDVFLAKNKDSLIEIRATDSFLPCSTCTPTPLAQNNVGSFILWSSANLEQNITGQIRSGENVYYLMVKPKSSVSLNDLPSLEGILKSIRINTDL